MSNPNIQVEITDEDTFHCFRLVLNPQGHSQYCSAARDPEALCTCLEERGEGMRIEIMFHAVSLVDLIHKCSLALCEWQGQTSGKLIEILKRHAGEVAR